MSSNHLNPWNKAMQIAQERSASRNREGNEEQDALQNARDSVRVRAEAHEIMRKNPKQMYANVKSKVAGNIKSQKKV